jgi:hypothetical protein
MTSENTSVIPQGERIIREQVGTEKQPIEIMASGAPITKAGSGLRNEQSWSLHD